MSSIESKLAAECKIGMKWRIKKNHLQNSLNKFTNVSSKAFKASKIPGVEFCLSFQLDSKNPNDVNIFLYLNFEMTKRIEADFKVSVKSALFEKNITGSIYEKSGGYGGKFCARDQLFNPEKHYFVEEFMEIEFEGTLKARGIKRKAPESSDLVKILWKNDDDKDLTINVKNQQIKICFFFLLLVSFIYL
uniref:MATH domain-containing protein n=1 Tax=Panagrolaimus superbus TaxID=310955 RepID=A0A914YHS7_9BILA